MASIWRLFPSNNNLPIWKTRNMNLEDAANIGEILGGLAILATLLFGLRQIAELNKSKEREAARDIANLLSSPMYQKAISILINKLSDDFSLEDLDNLDREQKDALNFLAINTNSIGKYITPLILRSVDMTKNVEQPKTYLLFLVLKNFIKK